MVAKRPSGGFVPEIITPLPVRYEGEATIFYQQVHISPHPDLLADGVTIEVTKGRKRS